MNVFSSLNELPLFKNAIVTIGTFDGVHVGHQKIIAQLKELAKEVDGETVVITFHPHPRNIVGDTSGVNLLTTLLEKEQLLANQGVDNLIIVPFDENFANLTAEQYVRDFLYTKIKPHTIVIGYDHHFGKDRKGNFDALEYYGKKFGFNVVEIHKQVVEEVAISSTRIRKALRQKEVDVANKLLGYPYFFEGTVMQGDQIGRTIGYPTANLQLNNEDKLVPVDGVYAVSVLILEPNEDISFFSLSNTNLNFIHGMMYIGSRPVVNGKRRVIEINLFDFDKDIYSQKMVVNIYGYTRGDLPLKSLDELKTQLAQDKIDVLKILNNFNK